MRCNATNITLDQNGSFAYSNLRQYYCWESPNSIINFETHSFIYAKLKCVVIPALFVIGALTNTLSLMLFYRQGLRDRMNLCLFCLAFVDLMYVTTLFVYVSPCFIGILWPNQEQFWTMTFVKHSEYFIYGFSYLSGCFTMIIAVERCVCVMFPMKASTIVSTRTMAVILTTTFFIIKVLCGVYIVKEEFVYLKDDVNGTYILSLALSALFSKHRLFLVIENIILPFISFFTFAVVSLATAITVVALHRTMTWRKTSASSYLKGQAVLVRMLVAVSSIYILCAAPNIALALVRFTVPEFRADGEYCSLFLTTHLIGGIVVMTNSSINFFVYVTMSSRLRHEVRKLFLCSSPTTTLGSFVGKHWKLSTVHG